MDTTIYRFNGKQESITKVYMQEMLHDIISDTTNQWDIKLDTDKQLYFVLIANNRFLIADAEVPINKTILDKYGVQESATTAADPFGLTFTLKSDTNIKRNLGEILYAEAYDRGSVQRLSQLYMFKADINAEAVFTTPLFLAAQPYIHVSYGPWRLNGVDQLISDANNPAFLSGYEQTAYIPWTNINSKRGDIDAHIQFPLLEANAPKRGQIYVKSPGVYLINGFAQFRSVTAEIGGMNAFAVVNRGPTRNAVKIGPVRDGGVPFTFCLFVSEFDINLDNPSIQKSTGTALIGVQLSYDRGSTELNSLKLVNDNNHYVWCMVTHLG
jgi:hypothetical protein